MNLTTAFRLALLLGVTRDAAAGRRGFGNRRGRGNGGAGKNGEATTSGTRGGGGGSGGGRGSGRGSGKEAAGDADGTVIVSIKPSKEETLAAQCAAVGEAAGVSVASVYNNLNICALSVPSAAAPASVATLGTNPRVLSAEEDGTMYATATWGIDRINQCDRPLDNSATKLDATDVRVYVIDTGIRQDHVEFTGRMPNNSITGNGKCGFSAISSEPAVDQDGNGHGTHVAGTICGTEYGVADCKDLCAVKVLSASGSGSTNGVIAGVNWVISNCAASGKKCVANMSLGGGFSTAMNNAVKAAVNAGVVVVVAAGNSNTNACTASPASEDLVITVGSTTSSDLRSSFSNYGDCVDVYNPGSSITSAWKGSNTDIKTISGTSMASPRELLRRREAGGDPVVRVQRCLPLVPSTSAPS